MSADSEIGSRHLPGHKRYLLGLTRRLRAACADEYFTLTLIDYATTEDTRVLETLIGTANHLRSDNGEGLADEQAATLRSLKEFAAASGAELATAD